MDTSGGGRGVSKIRMRHQGINLNFERLKESQHFGDSFGKDNRLDLEFQDLCEVDSLIEALKEFKNECQLYMGCWQRKGR